MHFSFPPLVHDRNAGQHNKQTRYHPGAMQAQTVLRQFMMHFLLSCHMNGFGPRDSHRREEQVHLDYVTP